MKTRTAPTVILFFVIVAVVCFGAWQAYAWATSDKTPEVAVKSAITPTTAVAALTLEESCMVFFASFVEYGTRTHLGPPPAGWEAHQVVGCVEYEGTFEFSGGVHVDLTGVTETCAVWDLGQVTAEAYAVTSVGLHPCPQTSGGPPPVDR